MRSAKDRVAGRWESFDDASGLAHESLCLFQDHDGFLWIGTRVGVSRYDGRRFTTFTTADGLAANDVCSLHEDRHGHMWFGTYSGGVSRYDGKKFTNFRVADGLANASVEGIWEDRKGHLWFATHKGISRYDGSGFTTFAKESGLPDDFTRCILGDRKGRVWVGTTGSGAACYDGTRFANYGRREGLAMNNVRCLLEDRRGHIWFGGRGGVSRYDGKRFVSFTRKNGLGGEDVQSLLEDREGRIWIGTYDSGAWCFDGRHFLRFGPEDGLAAHTIHDILQDREGSLWFACGHGGITRHHPLEAEVLSSEPIDALLPALCKGDLWWASGRRLTRWEKGEILHLEMGSEVRDAMEDRRGRVWVCTENGLVRYRNRRALTRQEPESPGRWSEIPCRGTWRILEDRRGAVWVGTADGLFRFDGKAYVPIAGSVAKSASCISSLLEDGRGRIWFGSWQGGGLAVWDGKFCRRYTTKDGLPDDRIYCLAEDCDGRIWIGTTEGMSCFDGTSFRNITAAEGLAGSFVQRIAWDRKGCMWIGTLGAGVSRFDGKTFQSLTAEDGLPSNAVTGLLEQPKGSFVIATYKGVCRYTPDCGVAPRIRIEGVEALRLSRESGGVYLVEGPGPVTVRFGGISLRTRKMRYRYKMEGCDLDWRQTWEPAVRYEHLHRGEYTFRVLAVDRDLTCSEAPAEARLRVAAHPQDQRVAQLEKEVQARTETLESLIGRTNAVWQALADGRVAISAHGMIERIDPSLCSILELREADLVGKPLAALLVEEKGLLQVLMDSLPDTIYFKDNQSRFILVNRALTTRFGLDHPGETVGKTDFDFFTEEHAREAREDELEVLRSGQPIVGKVEKETWPDGSETWVSTTKMPLQDRQGKTIGTFGVSRDITAEREAENTRKREHELLQTVIENLPVWIYVKDRQSRFVLLNTAAIRGLQRESPADIVGKTDFDLLRNWEDASRNFEAEQNLMRTGEPIADVEVAFEDREGKKTWLLVSKVPLRDHEGAIVGLVGVNRDITRLKEMEQQLRNTNCQLSATLIELKQAQLQTIQNERLRALGEMSSGIAHDFNNALVPILGLADLLVSSPENLKDRDQTLNDLRAILAAAKDAARTVRRMRDFYRPADTGEHAPLNLNEVIEKLVQATRPKWKEEKSALGIQIQVVTELGEIPTVPGDESELRQALTNLVLNAIEALPKGGTITIRSRRDRTGVTVDVADTGVGMTEDVRRRCFEPFFTTKGPAGSGLGLSLVHGVVRRHGGTVSIETEPGKGTTVSLHLPCPASAAGTEVPSSSEVRPLERVRVLLVDDEAPTRHLIEKFLRTDGHSVTSACSGQEGLDKFAAGHFDLVITDRAMPDMSGDQVAESVKRLRPQVPVVMLTGFGDLMRERGEVPKGVDLVLTKPVSYENLRRGLAAAAATISPTA